MALAAAGTKPPRRAGARGCLGVGKGQPCCQPAAAQQTATHWTSSSGRARPQASPESEQCPLATHLHLVFGRSLWTGHNCWSERAEGIKSSAARLQQPPAFHLRMRRNLLHGQLYCNLHDADFGSSSPAPAGQPQGQRSLGRRDGLAGVWSGRQFQGWHREQRGGATRRHGQPGTRAAGGGVSAAAAAVAGGPGRGSQRHAGAHHGAGAGGHG